MSSASVFALAAVSKNDVASGFTPGPPGMLGFTAALGL